MSNTQLFVNVNEDINKISMSVNVSVINYTNKHRVNKNNIKNIKKIFVVF